MKWESIKILLSDQEYSAAVKGLQYLLNNKRLENNKLLYILNLENKLIVGDFLGKYKNFSDKNLATITIYIQANLYHNNKVYVSDLIDFASNWGLELPYEKCINLLNSDAEENKYVVSSAMTYLYENFKYIYFDQLFDSFENILKNQNYFQSCQVKASFFLFRITHHRKYLDQLIDLVINGQSLNKELITNILDDEYNNGKYFSLPRELNNLIMNSI